MDKSDKFGSSDSPIDGEEMEEASDASSMPLIFQRKNVKSRRDQIHVYLQNDTEQDLRDLERKFGRIFSEDTVYDLDVREAVIMAGLENAERAKEIMESWGYGMR